MTQQINPDIVALLIAEFARSDTRELHVRSGDFELYLSNDATLRTVAVAGQSKRDHTALAPAAAAPRKPANAIASEEPAPAPPTTLPAGAVIITASNLGTFYRAPKPGAANYVEIGSKVGIGDELCLIEVMKLFTALRSETAGTVHAVLVEDGTMVKAGQPLFALLVN